MIIKYKEFLNENNTIKHDSFKIKVDYEVGYADIDTRGILLSALQKSNTGWSDICYLDGYSFKYEPKNSKIMLKEIDSTYGSEIFEVIYNEYRDEFDVLDKEDDIFINVKDIINRITFYTYRSVYTMDKRQKTDIKIKNITKI